MSGRLAAIFCPGSVALIGGSRDASSMGGTLLRNLLDSFRGPVYLVHPRVDEIAGRRTWSSILDVPHPVDLAIVAVPAAQVPATIDQCLRKSVRGLIVISAGFAETGAAGRAVEEEVRARLAESRVPLVGPNCLGVLNTDPASPLNATFSLADPAAGDVAVCTQSGALAFVFPNYMQRWRLGVAQMISLGNKSDVGENDVLEQWTDDSRIRVVQVYLESFQDPRGFVSTARRVARHRPLIVLLGGQTTAGSRAAGSHTAALASPAALARAAVLQAGGVAAESLAELFEATAQLALQPLPTGRRVAILTNAGGPGVLCADALEARGLAVPELSSALQQRLRTHVPPQAAVANPVDLIGTTSPDEFARCLDELLRSAEVDQIVILYVPRLPGTAGAVAQAVVDAASLSRHAKTLSAVFMESSGPPAELTATSVRIPSFEFPESAARALALATQYAEWRRREAADTVAFRRRRATRSATSPSPATSALLAGRSGWLEPACVHSILSDAGLDTPGWGEAHSVEQALVLAERIGWPVTLKVIAPSVLHKSRAGGVANDLRTPNELVRAYERVTAVASDAAGVLVQAFLAGGKEVFVGLQRDARFGMVLACGRGGVEVERGGNVAFRLLPVTTLDIDSLLDDAAARGWLVNDAFSQEALGKVIDRVVAFAAAHPNLAEADFNPIAFRAGQAPVVLDARIRITSS